MKIPTYFKESNYKIVEVEEDFSSIRIVNEVEADEIKEEIMDYFQNMKDFYKQVLEEDGNVLVTIY